MLYACMKVIKKALESDRLLTKLSNLLNAVRLNVKKKNPGSVM